MISESNGRQGVAENASAQMFNGYADCSDWSDECPSNNQESTASVFSSRYELIGNPILRTILWVFCIFAIFGNLVSTTSFGLATIAPLVAV